MILLTIMMLLLTRITALDMLMYEIALNQPESEDAVLELYALGWQQTSPFHRMHILGILHCIVMDEVFQFAMSQNYPKP